VITFANGAARLLRRLEVNKGLSCRLVISTYNQLAAIWLQTEALEKLDDVELCGIEGQALDLDNAVTAMMTTMTPLQLQDTAAMPILRLQASFTIN
jgi:hypothetical protein